MEEVSLFLDHSSLAVTSVYLRRLEGQEDKGWGRVAEAIGVGQLRHCPPNVLSRSANVDPAESTTTMVPTIMSEPRGVEMSWISGRD